MTDADSLKATLQRVTKDLGAPGVVIHNAVGGAFGNYLDISAELLQHNFQVNTMALLHLAQALLPAMIDLEWTRQLRPDLPDDAFCKPEDIAAECFHVAHQPRSAWSFNVEIRPNVETW